MACSRRPSFPHPAVTRLAALALAAGVTHGQTWDAFVQDLWGAYR